MKIPKRYIIFVVFIISTILISRQCNKNSIVSIKKSMIEWNTKFSGKIVDIERYQQDVGVVQINNVLDSISDYNSDFVCVKNNKVRFMTLWNSKFVIGDSLYIDTYKDSIWFYKDNKITHKDIFTSLLMRQKITYYFDAIKVLDKFK